MTHHTYTNWQEWRESVQQIESYQDFILSFPLHSQQKIKDGELISLTGYYSEKHGTPRQRAQGEFVRRCGTYIKGPVSGGMEEFRGFAELPGKATLEWTDNNLGNYPEYRMKFRLNFKPHLEYQLHQLSKENGYILFGKRGVRLTEDNYQLLLAGKVVKWEAWSSVKSKWQSGPSYKAEIIKHNAVFACNDYSGYYSEYASFPLKVLIAPK